MFFAQTVGIISIFWLGELFLFSFFCGQLALLLWIHEQFDGSMIVSLWLWPKWWCQYELMFTLMGIWETPAHRRGWLWDFCLSIYVFQNHPSSSWSVSVSQKFIFFQNIEPFCPSLRRRAAAFWRTGIETAVESVLYSSILPLLFSFFLFPFFLLSKKLGPSKLDSQKSTTKRIFFRTFHSKNQNFNSVPKCPKHPGGPGQNLIQCRDIE